MSKPLKEETFYREPDAESGTTESEWESVIWCKDGSVVIGLSPTKEGARTEALDAMTKHHVFLDSDAPSRLREILTHAPGAEYLNAVDITHQEAFQQSPLSQRENNMSQALDESNFREVAQQAIQKFREEGMIVAALVWARIIQLYESVLNAANNCTHPKAIVISSEYTFIHWCPTCGAIQDNNGDHGAPAGQWRRPA